MCEKEKDSTCVREKDKDCECVKKKKIVSAERARTHIISEKDNMCLCVRAC